MCCENHSTICEATNPEGLNQNFSGKIEMHLWRLCRSLAWLNAFRPGALLSLSRYLAPQKTCFALQSTEKGFSALREPQYRRCKYEDGQSLSLVVDQSPVTFKSF